MHDDPKLAAGVGTERGELRLVPESEACRILGGDDSPIHRSTLWRGIRTGTYPKPIKVPNNRWIDDELREVHRAAIALRDSEAA